MGNDEALKALDLHHAIAIPLHNEKEFEKYGDGEIPDAIICKICGQDTISGKFQQQWRSKDAGTPHSQTPQDAQTSPTNTMT